MMASFCLPSASIRWKDRNCLRCCMKAVRHRRKRRVKQVKHKLKNGESKKEKGNDKKGKPLS